MSRHLLPTASSSPLTSGWPKTQLMWHGYFEMNSGTWDGHRYGIPIMGGPGIVLVNEDLFQTMGLPTPIEYARNRDWTRDLIELGKKITRDVDGDGRLDVFALPQPGTNAWDWHARSVSLAEK